MLLNELFDCKKKKIKESLDSDKDLAAKIAAITGELEHKIKDDKSKELDTVDKLLDFFSNNDIELDVTDLYSMIKVDPLKKVIDNIQGEKVVYKGQEETNPQEVDSEEQDKTVAAMAQRAMT